MLRNRNLSTLLILFLLVHSGKSFGQSDTTKKTTTVVFFGEDASSKTPKVYNASAIKLGVFDIISGLYGGFYEKEFSDIFTLQAGAGLTGRNWVYGLFANEWGEVTDQESPNFNENEDINEDDYDYAYRKATIGYFVEVMPKLYYADEDGMDGKYFGLKLQYRRYNYNVTGLSDDEGLEYSGSEINVDEFENQTIIGLTWGGQNMNDKTVVDFFATAGARLYKGERADFGYANGPSGNTVAVLGPLPRETKGTKFFFEVGLRVGIWWEKEKTN